MKQLMQPQLLLAFSCFFFFLSFAFSNGEKIRNRRSSYNKVMGVYTNCSRNALQITIKTKYNFTGNLYARGYPTECRGKGGGKVTTTLSVSPQECGVKIVSEEDGEHTYELLVYVQFDPFVQQVSDEQVHVTCAINKSRDLHVTGRSSMNVFNDKEIAPVEKSQNSVTGRSPKVNAFGISDLYPSNILNLPSKLQQMVNDHFKTTSIGTSTTTIASIDSTSSDNKIKIETMTGPLEPKMDQLDSTTGPFEITTELLETTTGQVRSSDVSTEVTTRDLVTKLPLKRPKMPSHIVSSIINIEGGEDVVPYKGIFRASPKLKKEEEENALQTTDLFAEWKPIPPPDSLPKQLDKWKSLLGEDGNDEIVSCWLDIVRGESPSNKPATGELVVGEIATLIIKVRRQAGTDTRIVSCKAHDGSGINVQDLVDEDGCSVDKDIMPEFKYKTLTSKEVISYAPFKAFKFPDHDSLHFKCTVEICLGRCKQLKCGKSRRPRQAGSGFFLLNPLDEDDDVRIFGQKDTPAKAKTSFKKPSTETSVVMKTSTRKTIFDRPTSKYQTTLTSPASVTTTKKTSSTSKKPSLLRTTPHKSKSDDRRTKPLQRQDTESATEYDDTTIGKEVVDTVDVFNSVEVRAPGIDNQPKIIKDYRKSVRPTLETSSNGLEDEVFCITSSKLLAAFGILIAIFILALLIALYWFVKDKFRRVRLKRNEKLRSSQQFSRYPQLPQTRFQGVIDYTKFPHLASPYHRFPR